MTQNQVTTLTLKEKPEGLKFSCPSSRRRKHLGLRDKGKREIEEPAFAATKKKEKKIQGKEICMHF